MSLPEAPAPLVLLVEDELPVRRFLRASLRHEKLRLLEAATADEGLRMTAEHGPDIVLLDLGLPDLDGLEVVRRIRTWSQVPILVISARGREEQKVQALDAGADDYLVKPFGMGELLARVRVALRHAASLHDGSAPSVFTAGSLRVDLGQRRVLAGGTEVHLTRIEYKLLTTLVQHAGKVVTHKMLLDTVWGPGNEARTHYLRVHMTHLRRKVEVDPVRPRLIATEPGVGYRLLEEDPGGG
jgi:two-component system, OmpR family, KDP operon response regulator KdpE